MTREENVFHEFLTQDRGCVRYGIHTNMAAVLGEGTITLQIESGRTLKVTGVLFVPRSSHSILSVAALEGQGYEIGFYGQEVHVFSIRGEAPGVLVMIGIGEG